MFILDTLFFSIDACLTIVNKGYRLLAQRRPIGTPPGTSTPRPRRKVVIIGAGFAGLTAQRSLSDHDEEYDVTVIDMKNYFEYTPGILRAFVDPSHLHKLTCSVPSTRNTFVFGEVVRVCRGKPQGSVTVKLNKDGSEQVIEYDYLLVGSGSSYEKPIKPQKNEDTLNARLGNIKEHHSVLKASNTVLIMGAGPVGAELAAEILTVYPSKHVIVTDMAQSVCSTLPKRSREYIQKWLVDRNCELVLGCPIGGKYPKLLIDEKSATLANGRKIEADLVFKCMGFKANTAFLKEGLGEESMHRGSLVVDDALRVKGPLCGNVFGMGDCMIHSKSNDIKLAHTAEVNAHLVVDNLRRLTRCKGLMLSYPEGAVHNTSVPKIFCVSLGEFDGSLCFNGLVLNGSIAALMKHILEVSKVAACNESLAGILLWKIADPISNLISKYVLKPPVS